MIPRMLAVAMLSIACHMTVAQEPKQQGAAAEPAVHGTIRQQLKSYVEAFNSHDAAALGKYWTADGVSVTDETGERIEGRESLQQEFAAFFREHPEARLAGQVVDIRMIRTDVAAIEGQTTLSITTAEPIESRYSAVLVKEGEQWLISSSHERDLPAPSTPYDALREFEWLVGTWEDQSAGAQVTTTVRWSPSQAFLIRSFNARLSEGDALQGTQVIGWDPLNTQFRTWTFNSDGSFGEGTASKNGDDWMVKLSQVLGDGRMASGTQIITRVDDNTITVQTVGQTVDGEPVPSSDPVTVVRTGDAESVSRTQAPAGEGGTR